MAAFRLVALVAFCTGTQAARLSQGANPIRRVVDLLQAMQKKVIAEGAKEEELFNKFMCYCKTGSGELSGSISAAETKIPRLETSIEEDEASKTQADADIKQAKADRVEGKQALATAAALREKEATTYAKVSSDYQTNLSALKAAIEAIEKGIAGSFLQTKQAALLRKLSIDVDMGSADRDMLTAFLSQGQAEGYSPKSGQIVGILKELSDTMGKELADTTGTEEQAIKDFEALSLAKEKEINALTASIESKLEKSGQLGVEIVALKEDLDDTKATLGEDQKFLMELKKGCETKEGEWQERSKTRTDELLALADTIKILNDDDALELFKKTLPSPTLLQTQVSAKKARAVALQLLDAAPGRSLRLVALALRGGTSSFEKVIKMIDDMVSLLGKEQTADDEKKTYCEKELDVSDDEKKVLEQTIGDLEKTIDDAKETIETLSDDIAALLKGIKELDKQVADGTEIRQEENAEYKVKMQEDKAAKDILAMAKNRLAKFYAPKMYKPPAKEELSTEGRIAANMAFMSTQASPGPPPETWGAYQTKNEEHGGVIAMMDLLAADLDKEITQMNVDEKDSQAEYEAFMAESGTKRATDSKSMQEKEGQKADLEAELVKLEGEVKSSTKELMTKANTIKDLHLECDWLVSNFEVRKQARAGEVDSLKNAKAVLSGADFELLQTGAGLRALRGSL